MEATASFDAPLKRRLAPAPAPSSLRARKVMQGNRSDSAVERALRSELHRRGLRFRKHLAVVPGLRCRPDVVFTRVRVAVFVDGCFWHSCPLHGTQAKANKQWWNEKLQGNVDRDRRNDAALHNAGWTVLRVWEHEPISSMANLVVGLVRPHAASGGMPHHQEPVLWNDAMAASDSKPAAAQHLDAAAATGKGSPLDGRRHARS